MKIVTIRDAKTNLSKLIREACRGGDIVIARRTKPLARLVPGEQVKEKCRPGALRGKLHVGPEFFQSLPADELF